MTPRFEIECSSSRQPDRAPARPSLVALSLFSLLAAGGCGEPAPPPKNLVLISVDTLRPDFLSCYGHERVTSPNIDLFAERGVLFNDVTSASPWTLPSHASMLTGLYPSSHGVRDHDRQLTKETLATRLLREGYQTIAVVNSHNIGDKRYGLMRGFSQSHYELEGETDPTREGLTVNRGPRVTKRGLRLLKDRDPDLPFFLFLHYYDVHTDFAPDPKWELEYVDPYDGELTGNTLQLVQYRIDGNQLPPEDGVWLEQMYEAEIRTFDGVIGRVFAYLEASDLWDSTIVAITSDHGEEYLEHGSVLHGRTYFDEVIRIPLLIRGPGIPAGAVVEDPVHLVDVAPTLLRLMGVEPEMSFDGVDLTELWAPQGAALAPRYIFAEADHNNLVDGEPRSNIRRMIRIGSEKLIYDTVTGEKLYYDLAADPGEQENLLDERPERAAELWAELERYMNMPDVSGANPLEELDVEALENLERLGY